MGATSRRLLPWLLAVTLSLLAAADGSAAQLTLDVTFSSTNTIAVTLPDGTPVGAASGTPTQIPAGYYTMVISGPMGLPAGLPYFSLTGPKVDVLSNLNEGGLESQTIGLTFLPSSTYTWTDDATPGVAYTFTTSSQVLGTAPSTPTSPNAGPPSPSQDVVGSDVVPLRGTLIAAVDASGRLSLTLRGKGVERLVQGIYRISITDRSSTSGLVLAKAGRAATKLTGVAFTGKRSLSIDLTAGRWSLQGEPGGKPAATITVT
jgi:hypothetical protein